MAFSEITFNIAETASVINVLLGFFSFGFIYLFGFGGFVLFHFPKKIL